LNGVSRVEAVVFLAVFIPTAAIVLWLRIKRRRGG
jgi:hypothetical protein